MFKKRQILLIQNLELFLEPFTLKQKGHLMKYFHQNTSLPNTRAHNLFYKKENNQGVARFQKQIVSDSHQIIFVFKMQDQNFKIHSGPIFLHQTEKERNKRMVP